MVKQEDINKYNLPADLAEHANEYCNEFIFEKEVKKSILFVNMPISKYLIDSILLQRRILH